MPITVYHLMAKVLTAWVMLGLVGDRPEAAADPILIRAENIAAVRG